MQPALRCVGPLAGAHWQALRPPPLYIFRIRHAASEIVAKAAPLPFSETLSACAVHHTPAAWLADRKVEEVQVCPALLHPTLFMHGHAAV